MQSLLDICSPVLSRYWGNVLRLLRYPNRIHYPVFMSSLSINDFLPLEDRICVSLCNRRLFTIFYHRTYSARPSGKDKLPVLRRLERDLPKYFVCYICHILHKYDGSECFGISGSVFDMDKCPLRCFPKWRRENFDLILSEKDPIRFHIYYNFYFLHLQLAMRRFYYGEEFGISTEALSYTQVRPSLRPGITSLFSIDAQICPETPGLGLRMQHMMFVHDSKLELLLPRHDTEYLWEPLRIVFICTHVSELKHSRLFDTVINTYINGEKAPNSTFTCYICNTDSYIEVCEYGSDLALVLTKWINLGPGLTPDGPRWKVHSYCWELHRVRLAPSDLEDSPRLCFENVSPRSLEDLRSCNLSYLMDQRYKRVMRRMYSDRHVWYLPNKRSQGGYCSMF